MSSYQYVVMIGRFQPIHNAHRAILTEAFRRGQKVVVVLGSHNKASNIKNPWTSAQREAMIRATLTTDEAARCTFVTIRDYLYNDVQWTVEVQQKIKEATGWTNDVAIIGHDSDRTSYYLKLFPQWDLIDFVPNFKFHATEIRDLYFRHDNSYKEYLPTQVVDYLEGWKKTEDFNRRKEEFEYIKDYKERWRGAPFPPTFNTVDSVVVKSGHVLVVRRKGNPGRGLIALPGGFLNQNERILDGALRELKEETGIKVNVGDLRDAVVDEKVLDHPDRSLRGRTISYGFLINLKAGELPSVKGSDDAEKAFWMPLSEVYTREQEFFEDHFHIINYFVRKF